jgi:hypothetical protein
MTTKTRYFMLVSLGIIVLGLSIGLVAYYGGLPGSTVGASAAQDELRYVPREASVVAFADVRDVMGSQLRQRVRELEPGQDQGRREFQDKTGIDIEHDIDHVVAFMVPGQGRETDGMVLARGRFDEGRIEALAREHGGQVEQYSGTRILRHDKARHGTDGDHMALAFLEPGLVALGSEGLVKQAIDRPAAGDDITSNSELMALIRQNQSGNAWAVGRFDVLANQAQLPEGVTSRMPAITWFSASGHVNGGISAVVSAEAATQEAADSLRDIVRGFIALAKLQAGNQPELQAVLPSIQLGGTDRTVTVSFSVPTELLDVLSGPGKRHQTPR